MDSRPVHTRKKRKYRLCNLPDYVIHRILSFLGTKQAVQTSAISRRWRYEWTLMPCLNFLCEEFPTKTKFDQFVKEFLAGRDKEKDVFSVKLTFCRKVVRNKNVKKILKYAFSHNLQQLNISSLNQEAIEFDLSLLRSQSLTHLTLHGYNYPWQVTPSTSTWELPALKTLNLYYFTMEHDDPDGIFSNFANLKNLTLKKCRMLLYDDLNIYHHGLSSLTLEDGRYSHNTLVYVDAPRLKNLTIRNWRNIHLAHTPSLSSLDYIDYGCDHDYFHDDDSEDDDDDSDSDDDDDDDDVGHGDVKDKDYYEDVNPLQISTQLPHLEKVDICIDRPIKKKADIYKLFSMLHQFRSVKFLTLNWELVQLLSSYVKRPISPFVNLEVLKIFPLNVTPEVGKQPVVTLSAKVRKYFFDKSPDATLTILTHEEIIAMNNVTLAQNLIQELQVTLEKWKQYSETNTTHMMPEKVTFMDIIEDFDVFWKQLKNMRRNSERTASLVGMVKTALTRVPPSSCQAELQAKVSGLSAESVIMTRNIVDRLDIKRQKMPIFVKPRFPD